MSRVLIVDDEPAVLRTLSRLVENEGHDVSGASNAADAEARIAAEPFAIALVDYSLRGDDGLVLLRHLRAQQPSCARVLISGYLDIPTIVNAVNNGDVHLVLSKPITHQTLCDTLRTCGGLHARLQSEVAHFQATAHSQERAHLTELIRGGHLQLALQPILSARSRRLVAHEALLRSTLPALPGPMEVITAAERCGMLPEISAAVARCAASWMPQLPDGTILFMNLHPIELDDTERLMASLAPLRPWSHSIVLEITEHSKVRSSWLATAQALRDLGFSLAIDDLGAGYNSLSSLATLRPEYIKVDMSIVRDVDSEPYKQRLIKLLAQLCEGSGSTLIAEGVETDAEADTLVELGVHLVQGYRFGRPSTTPDFARAIRQTA